MIRIVSILIIIVTASFVTTTAAQTPLTFEDAINIGLQHNYDILIARGDAQAATNNKKLAMAGFLPRIEAGGSKVFSDTKEDSNLMSSFGDSETDMTAANVALQWTLFDGFKMFADRTRFNRLAEAGTAQAKTSIENSIVEIGRAYFDLVQQSLLYEVAISSRDISQSRFETIKVRRDLGGASSTDYLNAQVSLNRDRASVIQSELSRNNAVRSLNVLLGRDEDDLLEVSRSLSIPSFDLQPEQAVAEAMNQNNLLHTIRASESVAQMNLRSARSNFMPRLFLNADYSYSDRVTTPDGGSDLTTETKTGSVGLALSWNLFNGQRDRVAVQNARIDLNNQRLALRDIEKRLVSYVRTAMETFEKQIELVQLEQSNVTTAEQNLTLQTERLELGAVNSLEFRDAQTNLVKAQTSLISAQFQARLTRLELDRLTGQLVGDL